MGSRGGGGAVESDGGDEGAGGEGVEEGRAGRFGQPK